MPSTLDLFILTFNCAKSLINIPVVASHLQNAFGQNAPGAGLPDLVVFSLQEVAPLAHSFIGGSFLHPYFSRYEDALNQAAAQYTTTKSNRDSPEASDTESSATNNAANAPILGTSAQGRDGPYSFVRSHNVGMTAILLFARDPSAIVHVSEAEVGFGAAEMGNKGAVSLRVLYERSSAETAEVTFVATHLAAMEWNLPRRNANWAAIMRGLTFEDPEAILSGSTPLLRPGSDTPAGQGEDGSEAEHLLLHEHHEQESALLRDRLHSISVFKPGAHLFVAGDLNYRISTTSPPALAPFPNLDPDSEHYFPRFFALDQLTRERRAGRTLHGLVEPTVNFPPTYKYVHLPDAEGSPDPLEKNIPWKFAPHRYPSWTDRVLYLDIPSWATDGAAGSKEAKGAKIQVCRYNSLPLMRASDHQPVFLRATVPLLPRGALVPPPELREDLSSPAAADPRVRLPVEIDPEAWSRRAAARRKEMMVGWGMFLWSTREGAFILSTLLLIGIGGWWTLRG